MHLDMTITFGNLLSIASTVLAIFWAFASLRERLIALETKVDTMWDAYVRDLNDRRRRHDS